jgi:hypothetical protein
LAAVARIVHIALDDVGARAVAAVGVRDRDRDVPGLVGAGEHDPLAEPGAREAVAKREQRPLT